MTTDRVALAVPAHALPHSTPRQLPRAKVAEDTRTYAQQLTDRHPWRRPPGTIPHWSDVFARGPVVLLSPSDDATYTAAWRAGRRDLWQAMEEYVDNEPTEETR